jgi:hypothetical protein
MRKRCVYLIASCLSLWGAVAYGEVPAGSPDFYTDPNTGISYRKVVRTIERPVIDQQVRTEERTTYRPEVVTTVRDLQRTVYTPVVRYEWQPRWHGRWNPFAQPVLAYHLAPSTNWEARQESIKQPETTTRWVAQKETVQVPSRVMRMERTNEIAYEPVTTPAQRFQTLPTGPTTFAQPSQIASQQISAGLRPIGVENPGRSPTQTGLPATVLGNASNPGVIATAPHSTVWR